MLEVVFPDDTDCPDCGGFIFRDGPRGGLSQNLECAGCGSRFNVTRFDARMTERRPLPIVWGTSDSK